MTCLKPHSWKVAALDCNGDSPAQGLTLCLCHAAFYSSCLAQKLFLTFEDSASGGTFLTTLFQLELASLLICTQNFLFQTCKLRIQAPWR